VRSRTESSCHGSIFALSPQEKCDANQVSTNSA
jgi:hypothetical protein